MATSSNEKSRQLSDLRQRAGLSIAEAAELLEVTERTLTRWERGREKVCSVPDSAIEVLARAAARREHSAG